MFKIWNFILVLLIVCICVFTSVSCVCASDVDAVDSSYLNNNCDSNIDGTIFKSDDVNGNGSFNDLQKDIDELSPGDIYEMDKDYCYDDGDTTWYGINIYQDNITINGNGHIIDGRHKSVLFYIYGNNVKIVNLTFMNSYYSNSERTHVPPFDFEAGRSPIVWHGDKGIVSDCIFYGNSALVKGGAITWLGNNGIIQDSLFINNTAGVIGGAIYMAGSNNEISGCMFINSTSLIGGEVIYLDRNHKKCTISALYDCEKLFTDGSIINIDVNYLSYIYESVFAGITVNLIPILYSAIISQEPCVRLNEDTTYYCQYSTNEFLLTLTKTFSDGFIYQRGYHFFDIENYWDIFPQLIEGNYKNDLTFIKRVDVNDAEDYEYVRTMKSSDVLSFSDFLVLIIDLSLIDEDSINEVSFQLDVEFTHPFTINSKKTWNPSKSGFDVININGKGSTIKANSGSRDENKWVSISDVCIFAASNLIIDGFNTAVENLGGTCIFRNMVFNANVMIYIMDRAWGAAILNAGECLCNNCSFTNNKCDYGGAIFNQGILTLYNCTFKDNKAYDEGKDILNVDKGVVCIDGNQIDGSQGYVTYRKSMSGTTATILVIMSLGISFLGGFLAGIFTLNPVVGILVGAGIGAAVGTTCAIVISSNIFNVHLNRLALFTGLIMGCALAGAFGGYLGSSLAQILADEVVENSVVQEVVEVDDIISSSGLSDIRSSEEVSSELYDLLEAWYDGFDLDASNEAVLDETLSYIKASV